MSWRHLVSLGFVTQAQAPRLPGSPHSGSPGVWLWGHCQSVGPTSFDPGECMVPPNPTQGAYFSTRTNQACLGCRVYHQNHCFPTASQPQEDQGRPQLHREPQEAGDHAWPCHCPACLPAAGCGGGPCKPMVHLNHLPRVEPPEGLVPERSLVRALHPPGFLAKAGCAVTYCPTINAFHHTGI